MSTLSLLVFASSLAAANDLAALQGLAAAAPPELHAAVLLVLADSPKITPRQKSEIIEQAFVLAAQAKEAYPRIALPGAPPDTIDAYRTAASAALKLDRLTLQTQAIRKAGDKLGSELIDRLEAPRPGKLACEATFVPDLSLYYETVVDRDAQFAGATSVLELAALAKFVATPVQAGAFAAKLGSAGADSRAFAATWEKQLQPAFIRLRDQFGGQPLEEGIRKFLLDNLNGSRCADAANVLLGARYIVDWYNNGPLARPIEDSELRAPKPEGRAKIEPAWDGDAQQALMQDLRRLGLTGEGTPYTADQRAKPEWKQALEDFVARLTAARPGFHLHAAMLQALIEITTPGDQRHKLIGLYTDALRNSDLQYKSPAEWLWRANSLYRMLEHDPDRSKVLEAYRNSNIPSLVLYVWVIESRGMFWAA